MEVIVLVIVNGGEMRGEIAFPERSWADVKWRGYMGQWAIEGIFGAVSRLLTDMRIAV